MSEQQTKKESTCDKHLWRLDDPVGPVSKGVCPKCGAERDFRNTVDYSNWTSRSRVTKPEDTETKK